MTHPAYQVTNPASGEVVETYDTATDAEIQTALTASHSAYASWKDVPIADRAEVVTKVAVLFAERADELAAIATTEMGKPLSEGVEEVEFCEAIFKYFATEGPTLAADQPIKTFSGGTAVVQKLPVGPLLGIMPWNFPYYQIARFAAPNLMLGNTIILKHAESVPGSALAVEQIMKDAGVPDGVYVNVFASHDQIETIIADPRIQGVSLTGSERAGSIVAALAGKNLKKCVLELGGSDPMVVLDTADLDGVVGNAWDFRMYNTGQACNANKRMIVMDDLFDDFVSKLTEKARAIEPGTFSPVSSRAAAEALAGQVDDAVSKGATLHAGGELSEAPAAFYSPAVLTGVTKDMRAYSEELFGPVAVVYKVGSDEEALALANDTAYGLGGSVFSADPARAQKIAQQLEVGMANVNSTAGEGAEIPFGGVKRSGFGRELGPLGMDEFVNKRMFFVAD
ncbi:succinate-semialdehyde dehydrogenase/glutarate-semialdehyde dehydrogenase [Aeromicrobium panaciterrae]|uniref:Succinate-semialdehyde dehydrogenase/glutarate-semialdehyde dehydrogenase n=1 Tax=Aeromicrobium panaciterrae TaxID=363861 RepID=A0ABU1UJS0_9ACTN|nr:NAD-dependent succinate-semialdehyde dehydrogenase [Aeromicrobium panaciterrae]MDR7085422.1 succinate-semialdehyde dehydrogenase/glutarate-semialdehyde dehydrogenase [Aeromicrobium panaciterrae]